MTRIIIADDDPGIQDVFREIFHGPSYDIDIFSNGVKLIENDFETPDVFILDKQLAGLDGLDICRFLKSQERTKSIPVIIISAAANVKELAKLAGADEFLEKPFRLKTLRECIAKHVGDVFPVTVEHK